MTSVAKGSGSDLKAGSQVSIQAKSGQSGDLIATQIVLFAPGSNRSDAEPGPDKAQLATIKTVHHRRTAETPSFSISSVGADGMVIPSDNNVLSKKVFASRATTSKIPPRYDNVA